MLPPRVTVEVLNGAGVSGLAQATAQWLEAQGINVVAVGTADRPDYAQTVIVDFTGKPHTTAWLARAFSVLNPTTSAASPSAASATAQTGSPADIQIILGQDWSVPVAGSTTH